MADSTKEATKPIGWLPLESNPEVLNPFLWKLGVPGEWGFCDVFGLDPELLAMVPRPCMALCLLFPCAKIAKERRPALRAARRDRVEADKADPDNDEARIRNEAEGGVFFLEQVEGTGNACGTVACIHAVGNAVAGQAFHVPWETPLGKYITEASKDHTPKERGNRLLAATDLHQAADDTARSGQTEGAGTDDAGDRHFVCFCERGGRLFELDGRNIGVDDEAFPVDHGPTTPDNFVNDAARVIRDEFVALDADNPNFNVVAFVQL